MKRFIVAVMLTPLSAQGQDAPPTPARAESVTVIASTSYKAGPIRRWLLGANYRDVWQTPIKVPVLDLRRFAGGLTPTATGGSAQTRSLRFIGKDGAAYTFRPLVKEIVHDTLKLYRNTIILSIARDALSALHPTASLAAVPFMRAAGVLHPTPILCVMPNDAALGEFREAFAGKLGAIEEHATMPQRSRGLGGALDIVDSDTLRERLNRNPRERVDARALLTTRLLDILLNDNDRHKDQWKWARLEPRDDAPWVPIARDRDKALISYEGVLFAVVRKVQPNLVRFDAKYPDVSALSRGAIDLDQRLLNGLEKPTWDSVVRFLKAKITDSVIEAGVRNMPHEYLPFSGDIIQRLRARRDGLSKAADQYYRLLARVADIHGTDASDRATVLREGRDVIVRIQSGDDTTWFRRRFRAPETREVRLYLHGGDDRAVVTGTGTPGVVLRVIGGSGTNTLLDSSRVTGRRRLTHFDDRGTVNGNAYGKDTLFNRRSASRSPG